MHARENRENKDMEPLIRKQPSSNDFWKCRVYDAHIQDADS